MWRRASVLPPPGRHRVLRRLLRWGLRLAVVLAALAAVSLALGLFLLGTETGSEWTVRRVVQAIDEGLPGSIEFDYAGGTLLGELRVANVVFRDPAGYEVLRVSEAAARIDLPRLLHHVARFTELRLSGVRVLVRQRKDYIGLVRFFIEPLEPGEPPPSTAPGPWRFDLPDIRLADVHVQVDLASVAATVALPSVDAVAVAGRGTHNVSAHSAGVITIERVGSATRTDHVDFHADFASRTDTPVDADLTLREDGDTVVARCSIAPDGFHADVRGDDAGIDLERYLAGVAPGVHPGRARDLALRVDGPADDLVFRLFAATDAGTVTLAGRFTSAPDRRRIVAAVRVDHARPVLLGAPAAPPDLAASLATLLRADLSAPSIDGSLAEVVVEGDVRVPGGPATGSFHADPRGAALDLRAGDGSLAASAALERGDETAGAWSARAQGRLAADARLVLPWLTARGPADADVAVQWDARGLRGGRAAVSGGGELRIASADAAVDGSWTASLDAQPGATAGAWTADGRLRLDDGATLRVGEVRLAGPIDDANAAPGAGSGAPLHVEVDADGALRAGLARTRIAAAVDDARGWGTNAPFVIGVDGARTAAGTLHVRGEVAGVGTLMLGTAGAVAGPFYARADAGNEGGAWRLDRARVDAAGSRRGALRTGTIAAELAPTAGGASHVSASIAAIRSGRTTVGALTVELTGNTTAGSGTLQLVNPRVRLSTLLQLRRRADTGDVEATLEGGLIRSASAALRFRGSLRAGNGGLDVPAITFEGQGATGRLAGAIRDWRRLRIEAALAGLPLAAVLDAAGAAPALRDAVRAGRLSAHASAAGTIDHPLVDFGASVDGVEALGMRDTHADATGRLDGADLHVAANAVLASGGTIAADLTSTPSSGLTLYVEGAAIPLSLLRQVAPDAPAIAGTVDTGSVLFAGAEHAVEVRLAVAGLAVGPLAPVSGWIDATCTGRACRDRFRFAGAGDAVVEGDGRLALPYDLTSAASRAWEALRGGRWLQHVAFRGVDPSAIGAPLPSLPAGALSGSAVLAGRGDDPTLRLSIDARGLRWAGWSGGPPPLDARLDATADDAGVRVAARVGSPAGDDAVVVLQWPGGLVALLRDPEAEVRPAVRAGGRLSDALVAALSGGRLADDAFQRLGLRARWTPPAAGGPASWSLAVAGDGARLADGAAGSAALAIDGSGVGAAVTATVRGAEGVALRARGEIVLPPATPAVPDDAFPDLRAFAATDLSRMSLDATVVARRLDLALLPGLGPISEPRGVADLDLAIHGPAMAPQVAGTFDVRDASFIYRPTAQRFDQVELSGSATQDVITIDRAAAASGGGKASVSGEVDLSGAGGPGFDFSGDATDFPLATEGETYGRLSCTLHGSGAMLYGAAASGSAGRLDARVEVGRCTLTLPRSRSGAVMDLGDHPDFVVVGRAAPAQAAQPATAAVPWDIAVTVDAPNELTVRREDMQMTGNGTVVYRIEPSRGEEGSVSGQVEILRGWADLFGRRFDLDNGEVDFTGRHPIDGTIVVRLASSTADGIVYVDVSGTLRHPSVNLSSDPPRDQSEVLGMLFLGRTDTTSAEQLQLGQNADRVAQNVVEAVGLAAFQSQVTSQISPLTTLRVEPGEQGIANARVRAGLNVLSNLYVEYTYQIAADQLQNSNEGRIEWLILRNLSLEGRFGDAQSGGIQLQFRTEW